MSVSDSTTNANYWHSHVARSDIAAFVRWVSAKNEFGPTVAAKLEHLAEEYVREKSLPR